MLSKSQSGSIIVIRFILTLVSVVLAVAIYLFSNDHKKRVNREKWKDYDECGLV
jgi:flagellar basal body-associated protein FliL